MIDVFANEIEIQAISCIRIEKWVSRERYKNS